MRAPDLPVPPACRRATADRCPARLRAAIRRIRRDAPRTKIEVSGGVSLKTVRAIAKLGPDRISIGTLTHSAPALDLGLDLA